MSELVALKEGMKDMAKDPQALTKGLLEEAEGLSKDLVQWRRTLHQIPELGLDLPKSSAFIRERLDDMGIAYETFLDGNCIVATLGKGEGPCILLRADFDALPVQEESGEPFSSTNGCMHACGHDMHAAMLLGAAKLLKERESELPGRVKLLFQPGEEGAHGAAACVEAGVLKNPKPDVAFAIHVASVIPVGTFAWGKQPMARAHYFQITIDGEGGHGSTPEVCIDPITPAAYIHLGMQELVSRESAGSDEVVITTGTFKSGDAPNVIPASAVLRASMRTFDDDLHDRLYKRIDEIASGIAKTYRCSSKLETLSDDPTVNADVKFGKLTEQAIKAAMSDATIDDSLHLMGSEDFSFISREVPSAYYMVGARIDGADQVYGQHNPKARFNERVLPMGVAAHVAVALTWLNSQQA